MWLKLRCLPKVASTSPWAIQARTWVLLIRLRPRHIGLQPSSHMVTGADKWWVLLRADADNTLLLEASQSGAKWVDNLTGTKRPSLPAPVAEEAAVAEAKAAALRLRSVQEKSSKRQTAQRTAEDAAAPAEDAPAAVDGATRSTILQQADCGECVNCLDKPKFGGPFKKKQACKLKLEKLKALDAESLAPMQSGRSSATVAVDCGQCIMCLDKARFGGPGLKHKACLVRRQPTLVAEPGAQRQHASDSAAAEGEHASDPSAAEQENGAAFPHVASLSSEPGVAFPQRGSLLSMSGAAYQTFRKEQRPLLPPSLSSAERDRRLRQQWKALSDTDKASWGSRARLEASPPAPDLVATPSAVSTPSVVPTPPAARTASAAEAVPVEKVVTAEQAVQAVQAMQRQYEYNQQRQAPTTCAIRLAAAAPHALPAEAEAGAATTTMEERAVTRLVGEQSREVLEQMVLAQLPAEAAGLAQLEQSTDVAQACNHV